jgi:hypothetical protein
MMGRKQVRLGLIGVASFVLLITVLPQVASGLGLGALAKRLDTPAGCSSSGSSGSSGSSSGSCCSSSGSFGSGSSDSSGCPTGNVAGTIAVTGAPRGFIPPELGVGACPASTPTGMVCDNPVYGFTQDGTYALTLTPGLWRVNGFYELSANGGAFLGTPQLLDVAVNQPITANFTVPYARPSSLAGTIAVTGLPSGVGVQNYSVLLCPPSAPYTGGIASIACVNGSGGSGKTQTPNSYRLNGLPPGQWIAYPGYCTEFGCATNPQAGQTVTLTSGRRTHLNLTTPFLTPSSGLAAGSVSVTGAPTGFSSQVVITACQTTTTGGFCQEDYVGTGPSSTFSLQLPNGTWQLTAAYLAPVFQNAISGPIQNITIQGGQTTTVNLTVAYQVLGTATGTIKVSGLPGGVHPTAYTVTACPAGIDPFTLFPSLSCVTEYSGPGGYLYGAADATRLGRSAAKTPGKHIRAAGNRINSYNLPTLTPGQWTLTASYQTAFGFGSSPGTQVTITAGGTTKTTLTVPYQTPDDGVVSGIVRVTGAPLFYYQAQVRACSAPPAGTCTDEQDAYVNGDGTYQLPLPPGTWWVSGVVDVYGSGPNTTETVSPPQEVTVTAGTKTVLRFTVPVTSSSGSVTTGSSRVRAAKGAHHRR